MAERIEIIDVTVPALTPIATPVTIALDVPDGVWVRLDQRWPPGPSGLVGIRVAHSGQVIIPRKGTAFLVTDDESLSWDMAGYPTGNKWSVVAYNTDIYAHTIKFIIHVDEIPRGVRTPIQLVPIG